MSSKLTGDDGKTYEVRDDGTLREVSNSSGGIIGAFVDAFENIVKTGVDIVTPSSKK